MFLFPQSQQIRPVSQQPSNTIDVLVGDGLQDDAAELVFKNLHLRARFNPMLAAQLYRNYKLAFRGECSTSLFHILQYSISKIDRYKVGLLSSDHTCY